MTECPGKSAYLFVEVHLSPLPLPGRGTAGVGYLLMRLSKRNHKGVESLFGAMVGGHAGVTLQ